MPAWLLAWVSRGVNRLAASNGPDCRELRRPKGSLLSRKGDSGAVGVIRISTDGESCYGFRLIYRSRFLFLGEGDCHMRRHELLMLLGLIWVLLASGCHVGGRRSSYSTSLSRAYPQDAASCCEPTSADGNYTIVSDSALPMEIEKPGRFPVFHRTAVIALKTTDRIAHRFATVSTAGIAAGANLTTRVWRAIRRD